MKRWRKNERCPCGSGEKSVRAWNAWRRQEKISRLVYYPGSPIPTPEP